MSTTTSSTSTSPQQPHSVSHSHQQPTNRSSSFHPEGSTKLIVPSEKKIQWGSRSVDIFDKIDHIGEGTYGEVYQARNKITGEIVALKKVRMDNEKEGFPITAIREIKILKELDHDNVVKLKEIVTSKASDKTKGSIYMVFEYMDHDLTGLTHTGAKWFSQAQIKCYMKQLLEGLHYCHKNKVLHRDIKGSNLLINNKGQLKLADFGLARPFNEQGSNYTNRVITLWYRPPELLLGEVNYGPAIDMWSVGCILAELLCQKPIFPGTHEIEQLEMIYKFCGTPHEENWPGVTKLPWWHKIQFKKVYRRCLREQFKDFPADALELVDRLLVLDPSKRISATEALDANYFWTEPLPANPSDLPKYPPSHELQVKKRRAAQSVPQQNDLSKRPRVDPSHAKSQGLVPLPNNHPSQYPPPPHKHPGPITNPVPHYRSSSNRQPPHQNGNGYSYARSQQNPHNPNYNPPNPQHQTIPRPIPPPPPHLSS